MIITRTPLRVSLVGGGTDVPQFYQKSPGAVVSFAINKFIYVAVNDKFDGQYRVSYSKNENVKSIEEIRHDLVRRALSTLRVKNGLEIVSIADIPGSGSGLGSSSAFTVGLVHALSAHLHGRSPKGGGLAELAYEIEAAAHPEIGKQDPYAAAYGGLNFLHFNKKGVSVKPMEIPLGLTSHMLLLWTGMTRSASEPLQAQKRFFEGDGMEVGKEMARLASELHRQFVLGNYDLVGRYLNDNWKLKRSISSFVSTPEIDHWYVQAMDNGAIGGKVCGAGGGGFLLFFCNPDARQRIADVTGLKKVDFEIEKEGSKIVYS